MQHDYYKEYYDLERKHWWFVAREKILSNYISKLIAAGVLPAGELRIANIGCGPGRSSEWLSAFGVVTSVEYDKFCCEFASKKTGLKILHGSITELPFDENSFDLVCAFDVIEHVADDALAVAELKRITRSEGVVLVTVPAYMSLWSHHDVVNHHFRRYKLPQLRSLFSSNDGRELYASYFNFFLFPPIYGFRKISNLLQSGKSRKGSGSDFEAFEPGILNNLLYRIMKLESKFISKSLKLPFGVSIINSWQKK